MQHLYLPFFEFYQSDPRELCLFSCASKSYSSPAIQNRSTLKLEHTQISKNDLGVNISPHCSDGHFFPATIFITTLKSNSKNKEFRSATFHVFSSELLENSFLTTKRSSSLQIDEYCWTVSEENIWMAVRRRRLRQ